MGEGDLDDLTDTDDENEENGSGSHTALSIVQRYLEATKTGTRKHEVRPLPQVYNVSLMRKKKRSRTSYYDLGHRQTAIEFSCCEI